MIDSVKTIEECEEHLSHISNFSHLILNDKLNKNIFSLLITSLSDRKFLKLSEIEYEEFKETLIKMNSFFTQHPILESMENEINALIKKLDTAYNISSFDEDIYDSIIKLKTQEDKKLNKDNKENNQKLIQREQMISEVRKYLGALNDFYDTKKELSNLDVSFKTKELKVRGHKLSVENSFKITKETLIDALLGLAALVEQVVDLDRRELLLPHPGALQDHLGQQQVDVVAPQVRLAAGGEHLMIPARHVHQRGVEGAL